MKVAPQKSRADAVAIFNAFSTFEQQQIRWGTRYEAYQSERAILTTEL